MIIDTIENLGRYEALMSSGSAIADFIASSDMAQLKDGKYPLTESGCAALVQRYSTQPIEDCSWESHREFVDIQCIMSGTEVMYWIPVEELESDGGYDASKDKEAYLSGPSGSKITLPPGWFAFFFPGEGHMAKVAASEPEDVEKIVIKVPVADFR